MNKMNFFDFFEEHKFNDSYLLNISEKKLMIILKQIFFKLDDCQKFVVVWKRVFKKF